MKTVPLVVVLLLWVSGEPTAQAELRQLEKEVTHNQVVHHDTSVMEFETIQLTEHGLYFVETMDDGTEIQHIHFGHDFKISISKPEPIHRHFSARMAAGL